MFKVVTGPMHKSVNQPSHLIKYTIWNSEHFVSHIIAHFCSFNWLPKNTLWRLFVRLSLVVILLESGYYRSWLHTRLILPKDR